MSRGKRRKPTPIAAPTQPVWYQSTLLWGSASLAVTIVFTVVAAMKKDLRWLLILAWPFGCIAAWELIGYFARPKRVRMLITICAALLFGISLFGMNLWLKPQPEIPLPQLPSPPVREIRPYDLSIDREGLFLNFLERKQASPRETLRVGCVSWSERACVGAGTFLIEFSKAGWTIDSKKVFRMNVGIPVSGVSICTNKRVPTSLPPHLGVWQRMTPSQVTINCALWEIGIPVTGSSDPSLPKGTVGVYFGPGPVPIPVEKGMAYSPERH